jgi:hypothetical protein
MKDVQWLQLVRLLQWLLWFLYASYLASQYLQSTGFLSRGGFGYARYCLLCWVLHIRRAVGDYWVEGFVGVAPHDPRRTLGALQRLLVSFVLTLGDHFDCVGPNY